MNAVCQTVLHRERETHTHTHTYSNVWKGWVYNHGVMLKVVKSHNITRCILLLQRLYSNLSWKKQRKQIWCDFDRASSLICGNKMPTRWNRGFYCRSYCLLNMFRAPLCPSSGAEEYYTVVAACGILCCGFQVVRLVWSWGLCVRFAGCCSICIYI